MKSLKEWLSGTTTEDDCDDCNACTKGFCFDGTCSYSPDPNCTACPLQEGDEAIATACDDQNACTDPVCNSPDPNYLFGACDNPATNCDDIDVCTIDQCDPLIGCQHIEDPEGVECGEPLGQDKAAGDTYCQDKFGC